MLIPKMFKIMQHQHQPKTDQTMPAILRDNFITACGTVYCGSKFRNTHCGIGHPWTGSHREN